MFKRKISLLVGACVAAASFAAVPAQARDHGRVSVVRGPAGGGYIAGRHVSREPGQTQVMRSRAAAMAIARPARPARLTAR